jgi:hypothetical protein
MTCFGNQKKTVKIADMNFKHTLENSSATEITEVLLPTP